MILHDQIIKKLKESLKAKAPKLNNDQLSRRERILNSSNPYFTQYGHKMSEIEGIVKEVAKKFGSNYQEAVEVFKALISSDNHEEKFTGMLYLNQFKKDFNDKTIELIHDSFIKYCDSWALCDSTMIKIIGPFLVKKGKESLARKIITNWSESENLWIRRASMVILLKIIMIRKKLDEKILFELVEKMLQKDKDEYILKGIGWLLKTCSKYEPEIIFNYLRSNRNSFPRLVLRYASEKLSEDKRLLLLKR